MRQFDLKERTLRFALATAAFCRSISVSAPDGRAVDQLFRSATSIGANYHASNHARSRREWVAKLGIVTEEAGETLFWLEFISRSNIGDRMQLSNLTSEARELLAIFVASRKTALKGLTRTGPP